MEAWESIDNLRLIDNNLDHILFELERDTPSFFRIARELHQVLYRSMVHRLRGSSNFGITGRPDKERRWIYCRDEGSCLEIHKMKLDNFKHVWRFSEPVQCEPPEETDYNDVDQDELLKDDFLKVFYDLLAMIQTSCFMEKYIGEVPVFVPDNDMKQLEWLHEKVRNEFEHYIPKLYKVSMADLLNSSRICTSLSIQLLYQSGCILLDCRHLVEQVENKLTLINELLQKYEING